MSFVDAQIRCFQEDPVIRRHLSAIPFPLRSVNAAVCSQPFSGPARVASLLCKFALVKLVGCCLGANLVDAPGADQCGLHGTGPDAGQPGIWPGVAWLRRALRRGFPFLAVVSCPRVSDKGILEV